MRARRHPYSSRSVLQELVAAVCMGYRRRWLVVRYRVWAGVRPTGELLRLLHTWGVIAHFELQTRGGVPEARIWLRYRATRPALQLWVYSARHLKVRSLSVADLSRLSRLYAGLGLVLATPVG
jgi:hypothetical protein